MILKPPWELAISDGLIRLNDLMVWCWMILKFIPVLNFILPSLFSWWDIGGTSPWFGDLCSITHSWCSVEFRSIKEVHKHMELGWSRTENTQASCWAPTKYSLKRYMLQRQFLLVDFVLLFWGTISLLALELCHFVTYSFSWNFATLWFLLR